MTAYPLFDAFPALRRPTAGLFTAPTPVQRIDDRLWLKRDDLSAADYGGNKVRKLDLILADARRRGARELLTFGYAGSSFVAATAWHGRKLGLHTIAYLLPQADAPYVADNLAVDRAAGAELHLRRSQSAIALSALLRSARWPSPYWIAPGGSTPLGTLGFVNAAFELAAQVRAGALPAPERLYVAFSSMGTVAGLALGLERVQLPTRIVAVQVVDDRFAGAGKLARLLRRSAALCGGDAHAAAKRVEIRTEFFGPGYAETTAATRAAIARFGESTGARADSAYTGKALACLYADADAGVLRGPALFWHTFNGRGLPAGLTRPERHVS